MGNERLSPLKCCVSTEDQTQGLAGWHFALTPLPHSFSHWPSSSLFSTFRVHLRCGIKTKSEIPAAAAWLATAEPVTGSSHEAECDTSGLDAAAIWTDTGVSSSPLYKIRCSTPSGSGSAAQHLPLGVLSLPAETTVSARLPPCITRRVSILSPQETVIAYKYDQPLVGARRGPFSRLRPPYPSRRLPLFPCGSGATGGQIDHLLWLSPAATLLLFRQGRQRVRPTGC